MPGCTALLLILIRTNRNLKATKSNLNFHFLTIVLQLQTFPCCIYEFLCFLLSNYIYTKNKPFHYFGKLSSIYFQMCKICWVPNLSEDKQNQNTAILACHINYLQEELDKNTTLVSVTPASAPFTACRWDEFSWRLVISLYIKITPQNHKPQEIIQSKTVGRTQMCCHKDSVGF